MKTIILLGIVAISTSFAVRGSADDSLGTAGDAGEATPQTVTDTMHDQCGATLKVRDANNTVHTIPRGQKINVYTGVPDITWFCGNSQEHARCPAGSMHVNVYHHPESRQIDWTCLSP